MSTYHKGYIDALKDAGIDPLGKENELDRLLKDVVDQEEAKPGVWLFRVYKDWGTNHCREAARIAYGESIPDPLVGLLGAPHKIVELNKSSIYELVNKISMEHEKNAPPGKSTPRPRAEAVESASVDE